MTFDERFYLSLEVHGVASVPHLGLKRRTISTDGHFFRLDIASAIYGHILV